MLCELLVFFFVDVSYSIYITFMWKDVLYCVEGVPEAGHPRGGYPNGGYPNGGYYRAGYPREGDGRESHHIGSSYYSRVSHGTVYLLACLVG